MNNLVILLSGILLLALILFVFYNQLYKTKSSNKYELISDTETIDQSYEKTIVFSKMIKDRTQIVMPGYGEGLTFKWDMYIPNTMGEKNWYSSHTKDKPIIRIGDSPHIYYNPKYNILKVMVKYSETPFYAHYPIIELKDIPLQRWNRYIVVINGNTIKIFFNGKQVINKKIANTPILSSSDIVIGQTNNNIIGQIKDFTIYFRPHNNQEIMKL